MLYILGLYLQNSVIPKSVWNHVVLLQSLYVSYRPVDLKNYLYKNVLGKVFRNISHGVGCVFDHNSLHH